MGLTRLHAAGLTVWRGIIEIKTRAALHFSSRNRVSQQQVSAILKNTVEWKINSGEKSNQIQQTK